MSPILWWFAVFDIVTPWMAATRRWLLALDAVWDSWQPIEWRFTREELERLEELRERVQGERVER